MAYVNVNNNLPNNLDVQVSISKTQAENRRNFSILCVVGENLGFLPDESRVRLYGTQEAVAADFAAGTEVYKAAQAFFSQSPRPAQMAIGEAFLNPQPARLVSGDVTAADIAALKGVAAGGFQVTYNPGGGSINKGFANLNFGAVNTLEDIAAVIDAATGVELGCAVITLPGGRKVLKLATTMTGDGVAITIATPPGAGTDVSALLHLTLATGAKSMNGYTPTGIAGELDNISNAANAIGVYFYGWCLEAGLRDVETQTAAAAWALGRTAVMPLVSNDLSAIDPAADIDLGSTLGDTVNKRVFPIYHDDLNYYPDVSILAYMLSVDYTTQDSTVTAKFKSLPGVPTVKLTETQWATLRAKGYNAFTLTGNNAYVFRDGISADNGYYIDTIINLDNFCEDLSVALMNVFLRNKKIPYTAKGQLLLVDACQDIGNQYTYNGTFADRQVADHTSKSKYRTIPSVQVTPAPVGDASDAMRQSRVAPGIAMTVQEAGAIHTLSVTVNVVS